MWYYKNLSCVWGWLLFVWFDSLSPINNLSVIKGWVFLGWTSTKLGLMFLLKDTTQWRCWGFNLRPLSLESSTLPLSHCPPLCEGGIEESAQTITVWHHEVCRVMIKGDYEGIGGMYISIPPSHKQGWLNAAFFNISLALENFVCLNWFFTSHQLFFQLNRDRSSWVGTKLG